MKIREYTFSLSGVENKVKALVERGESPQRVACYALDTIAQAVLTVTRAAQEGRPELPVLCSGGVASSLRLRQWLEGAVFAAPGYSSDNAAGVALLAWRQMT